jgi:hypothetical protein
MTLCSGAITFLVAKNICFHESISMTTDTDYGHMMAKSLILCGPNYLEFGYKGLLFCKNNGWLMETMCMKVHTVPKWVLINCSKIPQMPQNLSAQIVCPSPKVWDFDEKRLHWASTDRETTDKVCFFVSLKYSAVVCQRYLPQKPTAIWILYCF